MQQLRCPRCGTPYNPGDAFCGECGLALTATQAPPIQNQQGYLNAPIATPRPPAQPQRSRLPRLIAGGGIGLLVVVIAAVAILARPPSVTPGTPTALLADLPSATVVAQAPTDTVAPPTKTAPIIATATPRPRKTLAVAFPTSIVGSVETAIVLTVIASDLPTVEPGDYPTATPEDLATVTPIEDPPRIALADFKALFDDPNQRPIIVDVRSADLYAEGHIPGALNITETEADIDSHLDQLPDDHLIIAYCH